jgi:lipoprotein-anchoring transpeptidase ErfK/SrfK
VVLPVAERVAGTERDWYRIEFTEWLRYPERVADTWYVAAEFVEPLWDEGVIEITGAAPTSSKRIVVDRSEQTLTALEDDVVFLETDISTGIGLTPTPRGQFTIFRKTPSRYMQGPLPYLPASTYYDLPGVPWNLYFTEQGAVIHGTYWHNSFGSAYSSGCVNLRPSEAKTLYDWAQIGTTVVVRD